MNKILTRQQLEDAAKCGKIKCTDCANRNTCCASGMKVVVHAFGQTALALVDMLKRLEWKDIEIVNDTIFHRCPICGGYQSGNHSPDCELAALLRGLEGEK